MRFARRGTSPAPAARRSSSARYRARLQRLKSKLWRRPSQLDAYRHRRIPLVAHDAAVLLARFAA